MIQVLELALCEPSVIQALGANPPPQLSSLTLHNTSTPRAARPQLLSAFNGSLAQLQCLELSNSLHQVSLAPLVHLSGLQSLALCELDGIADVQVAELAMAPLPNLTSLQAWNLNSEQLGVIAWAAGWFARLQRLYLAHARHGDELAALLAGRSELTALRTLSLRNAQLSDAAIHALAHAPWLSSLTRLDIGDRHPHLGDDAAPWVELARAPLASLRVLGLSGVRLRAGAAVALGFSSWLTGLERLSICLGGEGRVLGECWRFNELQGQGVVNVTSTDRQRKPVSYEDCITWTDTDTDDDSGDDAWA
jgi:hypothetical protein